MNGQSKVTAKDIARELGLSIATVDRALNNRGNVKEDTYRKIMEKAKELNYVPNKSASLLSRKTEFSVVCIFPEYPQHFWEQVEPGIWSAYNDLRDYGLTVDIIRTPRIEFEQQIEIIQQTIDSGKYQALALAPNDANDVVDAVIDRAMEKGVSICTFNTDSPLSGRMFYVGSDYRDAGRLAADLLCKWIGESGNVLVVTETTSFQMQQKITGFREVLLEYPDVNMLSPLKANYYESESYAGLLGDLDGVDGIYVASATLPSFAKYLDENVRDKRIVLIGHDLNQVSYEYLQRGVITATICQDPFMQGHMAVKTLFNHCVLGEPIKRKEHFTKLEIVTKENAKYYL
ncbi:MAG TPA: LacI family DNA-binding transcriptional regulator [Candidatus Bathyarchaeia archaeon]|nr:LacI family DNA-binding transcriptional regulator [Candidatus Bathyarchaeia archaeon]